MQVETIIRDGRKMAILPVKQYEKLLADAEMLADIQAYDAAKAALQNGHDEIIPFELIERRLQGENMVKLWRHYRGLTQAELADTSGVSRAMIASIEAGHKKGAVATLKKLAAALDVGLEQLV